MIFLSTPSARRATPRRQVLSHLRLISIHALREEGDPRTADSGSTGNDFYPRPPRGGRQDGGDYLLTGKLFLSTPSARRATQPVLLSVGIWLISIHALREEGDAGPLDLCHLRFISIHALREEGDRGQRGQLQVLHISIHALREEGDFLRIRKQVLRA